MFGFTAKVSTSNASISSEKIQEILKVVEEICQGNFEARNRDISPIDGDERQLCLKINEMIDRADAYVRESTACLGYITENKYFRRIAEHGMLGAYGNAARSIKAAADGIEAKMNKFAEMVDAVASASQELNASTQSLGETANQTSQQSATVSAAAEEAGTNTQTVAAAVEQLNASIQEIHRQVTDSTNIAREAAEEAE